MNAKALLGVICFVIVVAAMVGIAGSMDGYRLGRNAVRQEAIEAGAAHWSIDPVTGEKSFVWDGTRKLEKSDAQDQK